MIGKPIQAMRTRRASRARMALACLGLSLGAITFAGCSSNSGGEGATTRPTMASIFNPPAKSGVQLWAENCTRCHNARPPQQYSAQQWDILVHHMRERANLTGQEQREITKFLQAGS